ncbi:MAG TPA: TlpA disulfide reductase family protein [Terriglobales bacterium]|nr:TlpA disulfide reductase family protein [Terriglobales bacterium]
MKRLVAPILAFVAVATLIWLLANARNAGSNPVAHANLPNTGFQVGNYAPGFDLRSLDGRQIKLSDLRGKPVLLNFWATWCAPCRIEMPWLVGLDQRYRAQGLRVVGVSLDSSGAATDVAKFAQERGVQYSILLGDSAVADAYGGVRFMPQSFFINSNGKIEKSVVGLTDKGDLEAGVKELISSAPRD